MSSGTECIFCKIIDGRLPSHKVWENDKFAAFLDINPISEGHTLAVPKKHADYLFKIEKPVYSEIFNSVRDLSEPLRLATWAVRIGILIEGFLVPHAHIHMVPLKKGGDLDPEKAKKANPSELTETAERIRREIKDVENGE